MTLTGSLTHSGVEITRDTGVPSIRDIAISLSQMPRFAGHLRQTWSVLDHSLFVEHMAAELPIGHVDNIRRRGLRIAALLHDAHEAITSDIATHFKTAGMRYIQANLDDRIMGAYMPGGIATYEAFQPEIKAFDRRALLAEAVVLHPAVSMDNIERYFGDVPSLVDVEWLQRRIKYGPFFGPADFQGLYYDLLLDYTL